MKKDLITVIVPVYNVERYLEECINSIINQTYKTIEIILVDDGSTDNSGNLCDEYKRIDDRIKVIHQKNMGQSSARNCGIKHSNGKYIFFLDSDDVIQNNTLELMYNILENNKECISICNLESFDSKYTYSNDKTYKSYLPVEYFEEILKLNCYTFSCGVLIPKKFLSNDFFIEGRYYEDMACMYKVIDKCKKIYKINNPLYKYRVNPTSTVHTPNLKKIDDYTKAANEMLEFIDMNYEISEKIKNVFKCNFYRSCYIMSKEEKYLNDANRLSYNASLKGLSLKNKLKILLLRSKNISKKIVKIKNK